MMTMSFYLHRRLFAQEYGRKELIDVLARRTLKSIARSTGARITSNRWFKTIEFLMRSTGSNSGYFAPELIQFQSDFRAALNQHQRTHAVSIRRTTLILDYLILKVVAATNDAIATKFETAKSEFATDIEWFDACIKRAGFVTSSCGHIHHEDDQAYLRGNAESWDYVFSVCPACNRRAIEDGTRVFSHDDGHYILAEFAVTVRTAYGDRVMDRRRPGIQFSERYGCWHDATWTPYANLIGQYHSSKSHGFDVIDSPWFRRHRRAFGLELEIQMTSRTDEQTAAGRVHDILNPSGNRGEYCYFERDGSIGNGFEIVTQPAGLDVHREKMSAFLNNQEAKRGLRSHEGGACGLHIHVGRQYVTQAQIYRVQAFLNDVRNEGLIRKISRRYSSNYCRINHSLSKLSPMGKHSSERYEALNVTGRDTIEFRIFRGSLKYESVIAALEFVDALLTFCMPGQVAFNEFNSIGFRRFITRHENSPDTKFLREYLSLSSANADNEQTIRVA